MMSLIFRLGYQNFLRHYKSRLIFSSPVTNGLKCGAHFRKRPGITNAKLVLRLNYCYRLKRMKHLKRLFHHLRGQRINAHRKSQI